MYLEKMNQTMSSLEIAQITGKMHKEVMRDIRNIESQLGERRFALTSYTDKSNRELIMEEDKSYHTLQGMQKLNNFWAGRVKDKFLNDDLNRILDNLKAE